LAVPDYGFTLDALMMNVSDFCSIKVISPPVPKLIIQAKSIEKPRRAQETESREQ